MNFVNILRHIVEDGIRNVSGPVGFRIRNWYYKRRMKYLSGSVKIDTGVFLVNPGFISIDGNTWIDKNCILIAGPVDGDNSSGSVEDSKIKKGEIRIGKNSHFGIGTIVQGHGGVWIGDCFTSSAGCRLYSLSNDYKNCRAGTMDSKDNSAPPAYYSKRIIIGRNVWLGLGVSLISASVADNVFVSPHSVVYKDLEENVVATGNPATAVKKRFEN